MLIPGTTSWREAIPVFVVAVALLFVPGVVAALIMRLRLLAAVALGPILTTALLSVSGVLASLVGIRWSPLVLTVAVAVLWVLSAAVRFGTARIRGRVGGRWFSADDDEATGGWWRMSPLLAASLLAVVVAFVVYLASVLPELDSPEAFPQHPDTIYHLAAPQWMLESGTISSLEIERFTDDNWTGFYPAAFHGFTATISMLTGASVVVSTSVFVLAVSGLVWPLGCIVLAITLLGRRPVVALAAGVASVLFTGFPYFLMGFGVVWPNLFGGTLLPAYLAMLVAVLGTRATPPYAIAPRGLAALLLVATLPGLVMAHPNAFISFGLLASLFVLGRMLAGSWSNRDRPSRAIALLVGSALMVGLWAFGLVALRSSLMFGTGAPGPETSTDAAWYAVLHFAPRRTKPLTLLSVVVAVGIGSVLWRHRGARWLVPALGVLLSLFWLNAAVDATWTRYLTWPWYNNAARIQAVAVLPAVLLAAAGLVALSDLLARVLRVRARSTVIGGLVVAGLLVATGGYAAAHQHILHRYFHPQLADSWVTNGELRSLRALSQHIPEDAIVAANAWNGGTYLYVVSGRRLLIPTEKAKFPGDRTLLAARLDEVGTDPEVCAAAQRQHVEWALTGGQPFSWAGDRVQQYAGIDSVGDSPAWREVARDGNYILYRRVACAAS